MESVEAQSKPRKKIAWLIGGGCATLLLCMVCITALGMYLYFNWSAIVPESLVDLPESTRITGIVPATNTPESGTPEEMATEELTSDESAKSTHTETPIPAPTLLVSPPDSIDQQYIPGNTRQDLIQLLAADYPPLDYYETSVRLGGNYLGDRTITAMAYRLNDRQVFQVDGERVGATLEAVTEHAYFWVEEGLELDSAELNLAAKQLENEYYPRLVSLFGQEWRPGMDNDPHFSVLHLIGSTRSHELGYFSNVDEYPRSLFSESNEQEIIYLNMAQLELGDDLYFGTLIHEMQHLIQWYIDPNESTWLNEGLSQLAELYAGFNTAETREFQRTPSTRLTTWAYDDDSIDAHYAAAYLFSAYLWEQLGDTALQELARHPANGLASVNSVLQGYAPNWGLEQFLADWIAANFLDDPAAGSKYHYRTLDLGRPDIEMRVRELPIDTVQELDQFGTHYIDLDIRGQIDLTFAGDTLASLVGSRPRYGERVWFVPGVNDTDARLTAEFDLTGVSQASLRFSTWYDLEQDYDFAYVTISSDGGTSWEILLPDHASAGEFGPAFNGNSSDERGNVEGWLKESISLSSYVGQQVLIRFEVVTDYETDKDGTGQGFAVDDISIPEIGYSTDVEGGPDGWSTAGFVQTGWSLPQQWILQLIEEGPNPQVTRLLLNDFNQGQWSIDIGKGGGVLAITPVTPFIQEQASYWLHIE